MATPFEHHVSNIDAMAGQSTCVPIPFPSRTFIGKVVVAQVGGVASAFTAEVLNKLEACVHTSVSVLPENVDPDAAHDTPGQNDPGPEPFQLFRVMPQLVSDLFHVASYFADGIGKPFYNMDGNVALGNPRMIYIQITPTGTGLKKFAIAINGTNDFV